MSEKKVSVDTLSKALEQLQDLVKGSAPFEKVESMRDAGASSSSASGATQVHHEANSAKPGWAGSSWKESPEDGVSGNFAPNGTDYAGHGEMVKGIMAKLAKGLPLTADEFAIVAKGDFGKDKDEKKDEDKDEKKNPFAKAKSKDEDKDEDMGKSLETIQDGLEVSDFLKSWSTVQVAASASMERAIGDLAKSLHASTEDQRGFNGQLAKAISDLGAVLAVQAQRIEQLESTPAHAPRSVTAISTIEKGFGPGGVAPQGEELTKSEVLDTMVDMVKSNKLDASAVVKFNTNWEMDPSVEKAVRAYRSQRGL